jgi:hypothetical protein
MGFYIDDAGEGGLRQCLTLARLPPSPAPLPPENRERHDHKTRKNSLSGYILILQDDYLKVTFLNCLTD